MLGVQGGRAKPLFCHVHRDAAVGDSVPASRLPCAAWLQQPGAEKGSRETLL